MKNAFCATVGVIGSTIAGMLGGWDSALQTLCLFMLVDLLSGLAVAGIFHTSHRTESGALSSGVLREGLIKKLMMVVFVAIGYRLDLLFAVDYIRTAVCFAFIANELLSIIENAGLMGLPIPSVITKAVDVLKEKGDEVIGD